jgi:hypothetical protein
MRELRITSILMVLLSSGCLEIEREAPGIKLERHAASIESPHLHPDHLNVNAFQKIDSFSFYMEDCHLMVALKNEIRSVGMFCNKLGLRPSIKMGKLNERHPVLLVTNTCFDLGYTWEEFSVFEIQSQPFRIIKLLEVTEIDLRENEIR